MENASKALIIAGGVFFALMLLALLVFVFTSVTDFADSQDRKTLTKQIAEFNEGYEAYNKQIMYGTDIITVVNKAIDHNKNIEAMTTDPYYINIKLTVEDNFETTGKKIDNSKEINDRDREKDMNAKQLKNDPNIKTEIEISKNNLQKGISYSLGDWHYDTLEMKKDILYFFEQSDKDDIISKDNYTYYIYSALTNFKKATFKCTEVKYREETGRIYEMTFGQIKR